MGLIVVCAFFLNLFYTVFIENPAKTELWLIDINIIKLFLPNLYAFLS